MFDRLYILDCIGGRIERDSPLTLICQSRKNLNNNYDNYTMYFLV